MLFLPSQTLTPTAASNLSLLIFTFLVGSSKPATSKPIQSNGGPVLPGLPRSNGNGKEGKPLARSAKFTIITNILPTLAQTANNCSDASFHNFTLNKNHKTHRPTVMVVAGLRMQEVRICAKPRPAAYTHSSLWPWAGCASSAENSWWVCLIDSLKTKPRRPSVESSVRSPPVV